MEKSHIPIYDVCIGVVVVISILYYVLYICISDPRPIDRIGLAPDMWGAGDNPKLKKVSDKKFGTINLHSTAKLFSQLFYF